MTDIMTDVGGRRYEVASKFVNHTKKGKNTVPQNGNFPYNPKSTDQT
jgi:hypothetical protein